ncbi:embryonic stem cell-specific 5-hydroxymethylcytosine-binding protein [Diaphorina citri]|uniref:Abasic site processing protein HMCES n=1 Tax=Diaphorina citri TaxID=121845 RepID=A0A3Q0JHG8_DIACI|nr:embryonic stem cell-specific 5-hydroxymethylcytosine-binding protein [Diaphorina citri]
MCGRTCCNLSKDIYIKASCQYNSAKACYETPQYKHLSNNDMDYAPSINCTPQSITPVLISSEHFKGESDVANTLVPMLWGMIPPWHNGDYSNHGLSTNNCRLENWGLCEHFKGESDVANTLVPMLWGMIPPWHSGDYGNHGLSTNNCRLENITSSKLYSPSLEQGKRCVVMCEGFYEWQTTKKTPKKQPYFVYATQSPGVQVESVTSWNSGEFTKEAGWRGPFLLYLAGVFNKWKHKEGDWIYSYSILTMEANDHFSWLHHRMPAVLSSEREVNEWLNYTAVSTGQALNMVKPVTSLQWHPVDHGVGNSRNKSDKCNVRIDLSKTMEGKSSQLMMSWLGRGSSGKREASSDEQNASKKQKPN